MATIYDIARTANVSHATVSMALRGIGKIRPETRERIMAIARDIGYRPNTNAVALKSGVNRMITMLHTPHPFSKIAVELRNCVRNDGYELNMIELELEPSRQRGHASAFRQAARPVGANFRSRHGRGHEMPGRTRRRRKAGFPAW